MAGLHLYLDQEHAGHCDECKWWQCDDPANGPATVGHCSQPELEPFELRVSGRSGCNLFEPAATPVGAAAGGA